MIREKITRWLNGGWNYPTNAEVKSIETEQINKLNAQLTESRFEFAKLQSEYTTLSIMYAELKSNPTIEIDKIRDAYIELESSYERLKQTVDDEYQGAYHRGFNDGRACAYDELGLKLIAECETEGTDEEEITLDTEDDLNFIFGEPMKELEDLCESLHR